MSVVPRVLTIYKKAPNTLGVLHLDKTKITSFKHMLDSIRGNVVIEQLKT